MQNVPALNTHRIRCINGSFGFIPHRFLRDGFFSALNQNEQVLYFFWVLVSDQKGISWYSDKAICKYTGLSLNSVDKARQTLEEKDLISWQTPVTQLLELPNQPVKKANEHPAAKIRRILTGE